MNSKSKVSLQIKLKHQINLANPQILASLQILTETKVKIFFIFLLQKIIVIIGMYTGLSKTKQNRKPKTSILFEVRHLNETNSELGQSINIISLNTPNPKLNLTASKTHIGGEANFPKNQTTFYHTNKIEMRRCSAGNRLGLRIGALHQIDRNSTSIHGHRRNEDLIDKAVRKYQLLTENGKHPDSQHFPSILSDFVSKIDHLQAENSELTKRMKKFQNYFKQLKAKEDTENIDVLQEFTNCKNDKTSQLKILNLERKVETLNYIIKNYRMNNNQEVKEFEKKVNDYKPTIEIQLTELLSEANQKKEDLSNMVQYFQRECKKHYKDGNWVEIVRSLQQKDHSIQTISQTLQEIQKQNNLLKAQIQLIKQVKVQYQKVEHENDDFKDTILLMQSKIQELLKDKERIQCQCHDLQRSLEELSFKHQALVPLQGKIKQKEEILRRNSKTINRIQNQNQSLKSKVGSLVKSSQIDLFNNEEGPVDTIEKCSISIEEMSSRFSQEVENLPEVNKQLLSFIIHLYNKTKISFEKIVEQYKQQLQNTFLQNKQLKSRINTLIASNKHQFQIKTQVIEEIKNVQSKKKRCVESQNKLKSQQGCMSCISWVMYWGQMNSLYNEMQGFTNQLTQLE